MTATNSTEEKNKVTNKLVFSAFFLGVLTASASTITMDVNTLDFANRAGTLSFSENGGRSEVSGWAGVIQLKFDGAPSTGFYDSLCVDLFHDISVYSSYQVTPQAVSSIVNGGRVAWLYNNWVSLGSMQSVAQTLGVTTNEVGMALQLAIWDIVHDNGDGLNRGLVRSTSGTGQNVVRTANYFEQASAGQVASDAAIYVDAVNGIVTQRQISVPFAMLTQNSFAVETPEPGTVGLAGLALAGIVAASRLRRA